jgi:hypothetical protein
MIQADEPIHGIVGFPDARVKLLLSAGVFGVKAHIPEP